MRTYWKVAVVFAGASLVAGMSIYWHRHLSEKVAAKELSDRIRDYKIRAARGDSIAQSALSFLYFTGHGVPRDFVAGQYWAREAATRGSVEAEEILGISYSLGRGVPQDYGESIRWFQMAADQGYGRAQFDLGSMYYHGRGVPRNYPEAIHWFREAANQNIREAEFSLGVCYEEGRGVPSNRSEAIQWYLRAASDGDSSARYALYRMPETTPWGRRTYALISLLTIFALIVLLIPGRGFGRIRSLRWSVSLLLSTVILVYVLVLSIATLGALEGAPPGVRSAGVGRIVLLSILTGLSGIFAVVSTVAALREWKGQQPIT